MARFATSCLQDQGPCGKSRQPGHEGRGARGRTDFEGPSVSSCISHSLSSSHISFQDIFLVRFWLDFLGVTGFFCFRLGFFAGCSCREFRELDGIGTSSTQPFFPTLQKKTSTWQFCDRDIFGMGEFT